MIHCLRIAVFVFLLLNCTRLVAQPGFSTPIFSNVHAGDVLDIPVQVTNFDSIVSVQFVLRWDPSVLQFQSISNYNLPDMKSDNFGTLSALDSGFIRVAWVFYTAAGTTLTDKAAIFHIKLKVVGPINSGTKIDFTELPPLTYFEVVNASSKIWTLNQAIRTSGFAAVGYTYVGTDEPGNEFTVSAFPNPFSEKTWVKFDLPNPTTLHAQLVNAQGQLLFEKIGQWPAGPGGMEIAYPGSDKSGICFLVIHSSAGSHATLLMLND